MDNDIVLESELSKKLSEFKGGIAVVAFSGGLDTSFCVPFLREKYGLSRIVTCTVDTGGFSEEELKTIDARSKEVGSDKHYSIDGSEDYYDEIIKYLIYGNISRDGYPLCVGSERLVQGKHALEVCKKENANIFVHGSSGAGNDQYRFDLIAAVLGKGDIKVIAPVREFRFSRDFEMKFLREHGITANEKNTKYSYNIGLWGNYIGGGETHKSECLLPSDQWISHIRQGVEPKVIQLYFESGEIQKLVFDEVVTEGQIACIRKLTKIGSDYGIGRHYQVGTSIPGKKGRFSYESPAADLIYEAHRALEKITLSQSQIYWKKILAEECGRLLHEARFFDPHYENLKTYLRDTQKYVTGKCNIYLEPGYISAVTVTSPYNLLNAMGSVYGEENSYYNGADAEGASRLHGYEQVIFNSVINTTK
ncbi:MAG TPA: argininosuccinate synthase [Oligoflexia bacterium]|nr:argininosuccinate synthase [Oligoflexia bacterium]HMP48925.1 argininosuccinate synthase [Oligoflexia bacterium]